jgi:DNA-directed RNA polymerase alpha subunit
VTREELIVAFFDEVLMPAFVKALPPSPLPTDNRTVHDLPVGVRTFNAILNHTERQHLPPWTVTQMRLLRDSDFLRIKNFGRRSLNEIREVLATLGPA